MGIETETQPERPRITVLTKKGRRVIENSDEVVDRLTTAFPYADIVTVDGKDLAMMSMKSQVSE